MRKHKILTAALAASLLTGASAMAQLNYVNGDLLMGFGKTGSSDLLLNLGSIANFQGGNGTIPAPATYTYDLNSILTSTFGGLSGVKWSVFGVNDLNNNPLPGITQGSANTVWASSTTAIRTVPGNDTTDAFLVNPFNQIRTLVINDLIGAGNASVPQGTGNSTVAGAITALSSIVDGYSSQQINYSGGQGLLNGTWAWNMLRTQPSTGSGTLFLEQNDAYNTGNSAFNLGSFVLGANGILTVSVVPEPSSMALVGIGSLAFIALRNRNKKS